MQIKNNAQGVSLKHGRCGRKSPLLAKNARNGAPGVRSLETLCNFSFAPSGLARFSLATHGLRRGLHSFAAPRLEREGASFGKIASFRNTLFSVMLYLP